MNPEREANYETMRSTDAVIPFPKGETSEADYRREVEERNEATKQKVAAMSAYFKVWFKKTIGLDAARAKRFGEKYSYRLSIKWVMENICCPDTIKHLAKVIAAETKNAAPEWPEKVDNWDIMKAFFNVVRRYNYGMKMGNVGHIVLCDSDHRTSQTVSTGDMCWTTPENLTFTLWVVENGDYDQPWTLEWCPDPEDPTKRVQIKKYVKVAVVLKPFEKKVHSDGSRLSKALSLKEGEQVTFKFDSDHPSEALDRIDDFMGLLSKASIDNNVRFHTQQVDDYRLVVANCGKLYR